MDGVERADVVKSFLEKGTLEVKAFFDGSTHEGFLRLTKAKFVEE